MKVYAFDVDETMELSGGPITLVSISSLREEGHIIGICGNWAVVTGRLVGWHRIFSFLSVGDKAEFLKQIKSYVPADDYIMVGNVFGVSGASDDNGAAMAAGWRFIKESDFAEGTR